MMRRALPPLVAAGAVLVLVLHWPVPLHLSSWTAPSAFGGDHVWAFSHIERMLLGDLPLRLDTNQLGFPIHREARFIAWVPALLALPLQRLLGPVGAYHVVLWITPVFALLVTYAWLREATKADGWCAALCAFLYASSAYMLSNLAAGNIDKIQIWLYPLWLLLCWRVLRERRARWALPLFPILGACMAFNEPYFALFLPLFAAPVLLVRSLRERSWVCGGISLTALLLTGLGCFPAYSYYQNPGGKTQLFQPAGPGATNALQQPAASIVELLFGPGERATEAVEVVHVPMVGVGLVVMVLLLLSRPAMGRITGLVIAGCGLVIVSGVQQAGIPMPMAALEALHYPLEKGGQYYRAAPVLMLGLVTLLAAGLSSRGAGGRSVWDSPARWAAVALLPIQLMHCLWVTGPFWPREAAEIPGRELLLELRELGEPYDGVAVFPVASGHWFNTARILGASVHGHPATLLPRHVDVVEAHQEYFWTREMTLSSLQDFGIRFALLYREAEVKDAGRLSERALYRLFGEPLIVTDEVVLWELPWTDVPPRHAPSSRP